ncbi:MAG: serine/threonine protein kinase [Oscillospiraceae bacterium]|nr:serine/threonine protein kinase [Oscillospiraceae bacterium]
MTIEQELQLSYYREVADIDTGHGVCLVQDLRNGKFRVKKQLTVYNPEIYRYLMAHPIPNTPQIFLAEEDGNVLTVIEEYIPGDTLEELLEKSGPLPEAWVVNIGLQLCAILSAFHRCTPPIIHRDIKPSNIKLTAEGMVKLLDMNAAKRSSGSSERDTVLLGTRGYAAPEQYGFGPSSVLTDIYAVGVLMNVLLTGVLPNQRMAQGRLGQVIGKCIELSPSMRYQCVEELCAALSGQTATPPPASDVHHGPQRYFPPGFRSKAPIRWLFSALGYMVLFYFGLTLQVESAGPLELWLNRLSFTGAMLSVVFFNGNYLGVLRHFPLTGSANRLLRWLGMVIADVCIFFIWVILMNLLLSVFVR